MAKLYALDGQVFDAIPVREDRVGDDGRCYDCGKSVGEDHTPGCDVERCPRCEGQMIGCDCGCEERPMRSRDEVIELIQVLTEAVYP